MRRRVLQVLVAVSFALSLAVHDLWLRSFASTERVSWQGSRGWRCVRTAAGHLEVSLLVIDWSDRPRSEFHGPQYVREAAQPPINGMLELCSSVSDIDIDWSRGGFAWYAKLNPRQGEHYSIAVAPCWFLAAITMLLPLASATRRLVSRGPVAPSAMDQT
jgi:hypothetical protein